jgi:hypothetical protein
MRKLLIRLKWRWARKTICWRRGHAWSGQTYTDALFHIYCYRCRHRLTDREAERGEPRRYRLPWGDIRRTGGKLYDTRP